METMIDKSPQIIQLPKLLDTRGNLSFVEQYKHVPFEIKRTYWLYDVPGGEQRWGRSFKNNQEFIISLSGSFDVILDNGYDNFKYTLNRSYYGLYIPNGIWRVLDNFSTNSVALVLASTKFDENDYIRDYSEFLKFKKDGEV